MGRTFRCLCTRVRTQTRALAFPHLVGAGCGATRAKCALRGLPPVSVHPPARCEVARLCVRFHDAGNRLEGASHKTRFHNSKEHCAGDPPRFHAPASSPCTSAAVSGALRVFFGSHRSGSQHGPRQCAFLRGSNSLSPDPTFPDGGSAGAIVRVARRSLSAAPNRGALAP